MQSVGPLAFLGVVLGIAALASTPSSAQSVREAMRQDPACQLLTPASTGGPLPKSPDTVVVRWLGHTNYELVYRDNVFLLDAYYERLPRSHRTAVALQAIRKATAVIIGHPHFDPIYDAP